MPIVKTARDLGLAIRSRRKGLGWDQARLAREIGASRQWIVDIEKGKARAELGLILRAIYALGLSLHVDQEPAAAEPQEGSARSPLPPPPDIDRIVDRHRASNTAAKIAASLQSSLPDVQELMRQHGAAAQAAKHLQSNLPDVQELLRQHGAAAQAAKHLQSSLPAVEEVMWEQSAAALIARYLQSSVPEDLRELMLEIGVDAESAPRRKVGSSAPSPTGTKRKPGRSAADKNRR